MLWICRKVESCEFAVQLVVQQIEQVEFELKRHDSRHFCLSCSHLCLGDQRDAISLLPPSSHRLAVPAVKLTTFGGRAPSPFAAGSSLWNTLPDYLQHLSLDFVTFKRFCFLTI
jgi:hypothetical protein